MYRSSRLPARACVKLSILGAIRAIRAEDSARHSLLHYMSSVAGRGTIGQRINKGTVVECVAQPEIPDVLSVQSCCSA